MNLEVLLIVERRLCCLIIEDVKFFCRREDWPFEMVHIEVNDLPIVFIDNKYPAELLRLKNYFETVIKVKSKIINNYYREEVTKYRSIIPFFTKRCPLFSWLISNFYLFLFLLYPSSINYYFFVILNRLYIYIISLNLSWKKYCKWTDSI